MRSIAIWFVTSAIYVRYGGLVPWRYIRKTFVKHLDESFQRKSRD